MTSENRGTTGPKVSVLVPVFNGGRYLPECLDSILAQDFHDCEIVIIDDGSTDDSLTLIQKYAARDARIRWLQNPRNLGLTGNSNACLRAARGRYIKFVHQDDKLLAVSAIRKMVAALDANPTAAMTGSRQHLTGGHSRPTLIANRSGCYKGRSLIVRCLEQNTNFMGQPTLVMFRQELARRGFDERFTGMMDFEMWCHLLEQGDYEYLDEPLATWRVHASQQTARSQRNGDTRHERLQFLDTYYSKAWLQGKATNRMLFAQIYYFQKKHGKVTPPVVAAMKSKLRFGTYAWCWVRHKITRPIKKLSMRFNSGKPAPPPPR